MCMEEVVVSHDANGLVQQYRKLAMSVTWSLVRRMRLPTTAFDELLSAAYLGLVEAAHRFDAASGATFPSFAHYRIRGAVVDAIRRSFDLKGAAYQHVRALAAANELGEQFPIACKEIACKEEEIGITEEVAGAEPLARVFYVATTAALAYQLSGEAGEEATDTGQLDYDTPEVILERRQEAEGLFALVGRLPDLERLVIEEYYYAGKSFTEICEAHPDLSKSWISRLHKTALGRLRHWHETKRVPTRRKQYVRRRRGKTSEDQSGEAE